MPNLERERETMGAVIRGALGSDKGQSYESALLTMYDKYKGTPQELMLSGRDQRIVDAQSTAGAGATTTTVSFGARSGGVTSPAHDMLKEKVEMAKGGTPSSGNSSPTR